MRSAPSLSSSNPLLCWAIAQHIAASAEQRISFAEFMDMALYHPEHGYYTRDRQTIGARGDFVTAPHMGADFGELLAEQFVQMWNVLGRPRPFHLVEMGAGQGLIVRDVLHYLHRHHFDYFEAMEYWIIEASPAMVKEQQYRLSPFVNEQARLRWCQWDDIADESITGCFFSNELIDAFPVHQVVLKEGVWQEVYVTLANPETFLNAEQEFNGGDGDTHPPIPHFQIPHFQIPHFQEVLGDLSSAELHDYFSFVGLKERVASYPDGYHTEINLAALDWVQRVAQRLQRGYVLTIDYGYSAERLYHPSRSQGTLQCYYQHAHHSNPYVYIGHQDITAHVDFTALERQGEQDGLKTLGLTQQAMFLMALGLGDRIAALSQPDPDGSISINDRLRRREALHALMNPMGLGNFQVLLQAKGLSAAEIQHPLKGFDIPPL